MRREISEGAGGGGAKGRRWRRSGTERPRCERGAERYSNAAHAVQQAKLTRTSGGLTGA